MTNYHGNALRLATERLECLARSFTSHHSRPYRLGNDSLYSELQVMAKLHLQSASTCNLYFKEKREVTDGKTEIDAHIHRSAHFLINDKKLYTRMTLDKGQYNRQQPDTTTSTDKDVLEMATQANILINTF